MQSQDTKRSGDQCKRQGTGRDVIWQDERILEDTWRYFFPPSHCFVDSNYGNLWFHLRLLDLLWDGPSWFQVAQLNNKWNKVKCKLKYSIFQPLHCKTKLFKTSLLAPYISTQQQAKDKQITKHTLRKNYSRYKNTGQEASYVALIVENICQRLMGLGYWTATSM